MCDRHDKESLVPSPACTASAQGQINAAERKPRFEPLGREREETGRQSQNSLQKWICELLIENQQLRMSLLDAAARRRPWEADP